MTYMKCTRNKVKLLTTTFWLAAITFLAFTAPTFLIPVTLLAMYNFAYLMINPVPLPIVLSFVCMITLSLYTVVMNIAPVG